MYRFVSLISVIVAFAIAAPSADAAKRHKRHHHKTHTVKVWQGEQVWSQEALIFPLTGLIVPVK